MRTLIQTANSFDQVNTFNLEIVKNNRSGKYVFNKTCYLFFSESENKYYALSQAACIKAHYTEADREEQRRLRREDPIKHDDQVLIDGKIYKVHVNGDYSDAAIFIPV